MRVRAPRATGTAVLPGQAITAPGRGPAPAAACAGTRGTWRALVHERHRLLCVADGVAVRAE